MFIDIVTIFAKSGDGGKGHISFRREKFVPKGGPDGGNGGRGGDVVFKGNPHLNTLLDFRYKQHFNAENGKPGGKNGCTGKSGKTLVIQVPCGTLIKDSESEEILADITEAGQEAVVAVGGIGGRGNAEFATATNQAPRYAEPGRPGMEFKLRLELKLIGDVGLVGFPNAGKSTLISTISAARPKIAAYPFTTLVPNLGVVSVGMDKSFVVADIPGLIEGAHEGKGLGIQFLRHVERNRILLFLLDPTAETDVREQYAILNRELKSFSEKVYAKPRLVCLSKTDALPEDNLGDFDPAAFVENGVPVHYISSVAHKGLEGLKLAMWRMIEEHKREETDDFGEEE